MKQIRFVAAMLAAVLLLALGAGAGGFSPVQVAHAAGEKVEQKWTCPMHVHYIASEFGTCPICGMDLVALDAVGKKDARASGSKRAPIVIAPETLQTMGVRIAKAEKSSFGRVIRSYGLVSENDHAQSELTARLEGWVEELRVRAVGDQVKAGELLFTLYAPEFVVSQRDFIAALKGRDGPRIASIKMRLKAFGMQDRAISQLRRTRKVFEFVPFYADRDGTIAKIELRPGSYVKRGTMLVRIQDYSQVWLMIAMAEKDLSFVMPGTPTRVTFPNIPGREVFSKVEYVYPTVDQRTRTGKVRLVLDNTDGQLRPGAYADAALEVGARERLAVPSEAILASRGGRYVVVSLGEGRFESRVVKTGLTSGRWTEVSGEIDEGDDIVVSSQFLIDSESALRESFLKLERLQLPLSLLKLDETQLSMIDHMVDAAIYIHETATGGGTLDPKLLQPSIEVKTILWPEFEHSRLAYVMDDVVAAITKARDARTASELKSALAKINGALEPWLLEGAPQRYAVKKLSMFKDDGSGQSWVQMAGPPVNPYGDGTATLVDWPERKSAPAGDEPMVEMAPRPSGGKGSGHAMP